MDYPNSTGSNVVCFYHDDADGRCSAAIIRRALGQDVICIPMDYGDQVPWDLVKQAEAVVVVDFSFPPSDMERIVSEAKLTWIDHHVTAITDLQSLADVPGRRALDQAACVLTWNTYFPNEPVPMAVVTRHFGEGLFHENTSPENEEIWGPLLENDQDFLDDLIASGEILYNARMTRGRRALERRGIEFEFEGHRTLILNNVGTGDLGEMIRKKGYAIGYCYYEVWRRRTQSCSRFFLPPRAITISTRIALQTNQIDNGFNLAYSAGFGYSFYILIVNRGY
jgi:hypothetical protein